MEDSPLYMTDDVASLSTSLDSRKILYTEDLRDAWRQALPSLETTEDGERIMHILGHEAMSSYAAPYMKRLGDIVTRNGGHILNIGYGLGILDTVIESYRASRNIQDHIIIEINTHLAKEAQAIPHATVLEGSWEEALHTLPQEHFSGIVYDGYPLDLTELHRDGILFIETVAKLKLLKSTGTLTFFVDAPDTLGTQFRGFLKNLGFDYLALETLPITPPKRHRKNWQFDHFLAPIVKYSSPS